MNPGKVFCIQSKMIRRFIVCLLGAAGLLHVGQMTAMTLSLVISLLLYALAFGMRFAAGFILLLLVHEMGHIAAARLIGLAVSKPLFIPFVGAVISLEKPPVNAKAEANIAIGGPAAGTMSAIGCLTLYLWTDDFLFLVLAYTACILNLFNLIPCEPLDGGKIAAAVSPRLWWGGALFAVLLAWYTGNLCILIVFLFTLVRLWQGSDVGGSYYQLTPKQRFSVIWWYFGLLAVLGLMTLYIMERLR